MLSKLIIDSNGMIQLYNSSTSTVFGLSKFYIEDSGVTSLKKLLTEEYFQGFKDLPGDAYFMKNKNKVIGPVKVINGRNEKDIQTKISLISMGAKRDDLFDRIYLLECWIPDIYLQLQIESPKDKTQSVRFVEAEDDYSMQLGFHLSKRLYTIGNVSEQIKVDYQNYGQITQWQSATNHKTLNKDKDYGADVRIKYLAPNGYIVDRANWLKTEEDEVDAQIQVESPKDIVHSPDESNDKKNNQTSLSDLSVISGVVSYDIFRNMRQRKTSKRFMYSIYWLTGSILFMQHMLFV